MLFALTQLCDFCLIVVAHPTCVFPSLVNDMHIVRFALDAVFVFL